MSGRFVVLDGIDGCGKSTQMDHLPIGCLEAGLMPDGSRLIRTREPGGTSLGELCATCCYTQLLRRPRLQRPNCCFMPQIVRSMWRL